MNARRLLGVAMLTCGAAAARAQGNVRLQPPPPNTLTVTLVTFGLGDEVFERFGHNALWFHDAATGEDAAYQWGLFSFNEPRFLQRFLTGDTRYWMGAQDARALIEYERRTGRPITLQKLNLTQQQAASLRDFVHWNERPENRYYRYDYFRDNCSTRLRDALDQAVGGAIRRATDTVKTEESYRRESVRLTNGVRSMQLGIDIALGRPADKPLTEWESFFIPMRLRDALRHIRIADASGALVPLVAAENQVVLPPNKPAIPELADAPRLGPRYLVLGVLLAALALGLAALLPMRSPAWGLALFGGLWSLVCGLVGVILLFAWMATRHVFWVGNENVLLLTPLSLFLVPLFPSAVLSGKGLRAARMVAGLIALASVVAAILSVVPGRQENHAVVALFLPVHLALWVVLRALPPRNVSA